MRTGAPRRPLRAALWVVALGATVAAVVAARSAGGRDRTWVTVRRGDLVQGPAIDGELEAIDPLSLSPPGIPDLWNYQISFMAPEGADVHRGQPVLAFDTSELEKRRQERALARDRAAEEIEKKRLELAKERQDLELQLAQAEAKKRKAELQLETPAELAAASELAQQRIDRDLAAKEIAYLGDRLELLGRQSRAELGSLENRRQAAAARVREIDGYLERMKVAAPRDGVVVYVRDRSGEKHKVGDQVWRGNSILEIPDLARMRAKGMIDEADGGAIAVGQRVTLHLDARPDQAIAGRVERIGRAVQPRSRFDPVKVIEVAVALERVDPEHMRPGMRFRGRVETARVGNALLVPARAVTATAEGPVVWRETLLGVEPVHPRLGRRGEEDVEVLAGLEAGDRLAVGDEGGQREGRP